MPLTHATCLGQDTVPQLIIKVVDQAGNPIRDAVVFKNYIWQAQGVDRLLVNNLNYKVDESGTAAMEIPGRGRSLLVHSRADGYVPVFARWLSDELAKEKPPAEFTFKMIPGIEMGGIVVDEDGEPIQGVKVDVRCLPEQNQGVGRIRFSDQLTANGDDTATVTNEQGRWSINNAPDDIAAEFALGLSHPEYLDIPIPRDPRQQKFTDLKSLKKRTVKLEMKRGVVVRGTVLDTKGNPLERGTIVIGNDPLRDTVKGEFQIGINGEFELPPMPEGKFRVTVVVPDFAPQTRVIKVGKTMEKLTFELGPGNITRILVVDDNGNSIQNARVIIDRWQNSQSLYNIQHPNLRGLEIPVLANGGGLFEWTRAPKDKVTYQVVAPGYLGNRTIELAPSDKVHVVQLSASLMLSGSVVDKLTGEKIENFAVIPVEYSSGDTVFVRDQRQDVVPGRDGRFRLQLGSRRGADPDEKYGFRIEAVDYKPWSSDRFRMGQLVEPLVILLEPQPWPTARILNTDGGPAVNANVRIGSRTNRISAVGYRPDSGLRGYLHVVTDAIGNAKIPPFDEPFTILVYDKDGFGEENFANSNELKDVRMRQWASLKGQVVDVNEQPVADLNLIFTGIRVGIGGRMNVQDNVGATTDAEGQFEFPRLPPVLGTVRTIERASANRISIPVRLQPGKIKDIEIGKGIEVLGKIRLKGEPEIKVDHTISQILIHPIAPPPFGWPQGVAELKEFDWRGGSKAYNQLLSRGSTIDPRVYLNSVPHYAAILNNDGSFAINVREPGEYDLTIRIRGMHPDSPGLISGDAGYRMVRFKVDESHQEADVLDLGTLEVAAYQAPKIGTVIDDFEFSVDHEPMSLIDYRGSYVLLDFWSPRCKVCIAELQQLREFADKRKTRDRTIISLTADPPGSIQRTNGENTQWLDGRLSITAATPRVTETLGIWSFPRYVVVDPKGRLIFHGSLKGAIDELDKVQK